MTIEQQALEIVEKWYSKSIMIFDTNGDLFKGGITFKSAIQCAITEVEAIITAFTFAGVSYLSEDYQQILEHLKQM